MLPSELVVVFFASMAGSYHCLGMCGGFACGIAPDPRGRLRTITRQLIYNGGRVATYVFLGGVGGTLGLTLTADGMGLSIFSLQKALTLVAGILMILMAFKFLGKPKWTGAISARIPRVQVTTASIQVPIKLLFNTPGQAAPLALGVLNGFLPCPLVYAFLALAMARANPLESMLLMATFGFGTFPAMLAAASMGLRQRLARKPALVKVAGLLILLLGLVTIARAFISPVTQHLSHGGM